MDDGGCLCKVVVIVDAGADADAVLHLCRDQIQFLFNSHNDSYVSLFLRYIYSRQDDDDDANVKKEGDEQS